MTRPRGTKPGVYPDLTLEQYLAICDDDGWPAISSTLIRNMRLGPRECWHRQRFAVKPTSSMELGSLVHIQILDPQRYLDGVVEWSEPVYEPLPALKWDKADATRYQTRCGQYQLEATEGKDWRAAHTGFDDMAGTGDALIGTYGGVVAAKAACKEHYELTTPRQPKLDADGKPKLSPRNENSSAYKAFVAANPGRMIVTGDDLAAAKRIAQAVRDNPEARRRLSQIWRTEYTIVWEHESGALLKIRLDWLTDPGRRLVTIGELKTCRSAAEPAFNRQAADLEYHVQAALYREGFRAHFPGIETESICLAVENNGSHDSTVYPWEEPELTAGAEVAEERIQQILECRDRHGERPWPCRQPIGRLSFEEHGRGHLLGDGGNYGGLDLSGVERHGEE
jgi:hypothetical protein